MDIMAEVQLSPATKAHPATNSMVSIRLSDVEIHPGVDGVEDAVDPNETFSARSASIASKTSSSSSDGRDEVMSIESVDWEGLEKEEQERCEDSTDEVGKQCTPEDTIADTYRLLHYSLHSSNKPTQRLSTIPRPISRADLEAAPDLLPCNSSRSLSMARRDNPYDIHCFQRLR